MSDNFTVTMSTADADVPPDSFNDGQDHCLECGLVLFYGGRGRHPKYCDAHKPNQSASSRAAASGTNMNKLEASLTELYQFLGMGVSMLDIYSGMEITSNADKLAASWISLANTNPKVKKFLVKLTTGSGVGAVVIAHGMVALPIMRHHDLLPSFLSPKES